MPLPMLNSPPFDYLIVGSGLAGLQLALQLSEDSYFENASIAIIDPSEKTKNDKTWSFWEKGDGKFDAIVKKTWPLTRFESHRMALRLPLEPYLYKSIRAIDFYNWTKQWLHAKGRIKFFTDAVQDIEGTTSAVKIIGQTQSYWAKHVFDSRIPKAFYKKQDRYTRIQQHFKGWLIETETACFDSNSFTMMDYRFQYKDTTSFIYVLPFSERKALVEYTFFTPDLVAVEVYEKALKAYLKKALKLTRYQILETETGNIPMTDFPFWKFNTKQVTKIGTGGGWVKGSTGYAFKHTEKKVGKLIANLKAGRAAAAGLYPKKFRFYDTIFLKVLHDHNEKGVWIFERFYSKNSIQTMFRFLDEESNFFEDLRIIKSLFSRIFLEALIKVLFRF